ncbi:RHS repeat-associated core domain-containing protein [Sphaerisporangium sp. B11E5]|uniref:RHS repeat-associated core domain-containing protein n=1 Tax=Sphaerisporangium sp. B11E5 TaxID=3153563 RepID=UPI00325F22D8
MLKRVLAQALAVSVAVSGFIVAVPPGAAHAADGRGNVEALADATSPKGVTLPGGSGGASASGSFRYEYPIEVPPGRKGQQPRVALEYDSSAPVHGGVAAGWRLPVPVVVADPEAGGFGGTGEDEAREPRNFLGPDGSPLVRDAKLPVAEGGAGYRGLGDTSFTRYEYLAGIEDEPYWWRAFRSDGVVLNYGLKSENPYTYAPLVRVVDPDGHELRYDYDVVGRTSDAVPADGRAREFLLRTIQYHAPGDTSAYARVRFDYAAPAFCGTVTDSTPAIGSRLDHRHGFALLSGTRKLTGVTTWAKRQAAGSPLTLARDYTLSYSGTDACGGTVTPYRELARIEQKAYAPGTGAVTALPPVTFTYGAAASYVRTQNYTSAQDLPGAAPPTSIRTVQAARAWEYVPGKPFFRCDFPFCPNPGTQNSSAKPKEEEVSNLLSRAQANGESMTAMWLDVNGDHKVDLLRRTGQVELGRPAPGTGGCQVEVWVNKGAAGFAKDPAAFSFSLRDALADVPVAAPPGSDGDGELLCTLSRSFSTANSGWHGDPGKPCADQDAKGWTAERGWGSMQQVTHHFADVTGDERPELISVPIASIHCPYASTHGTPPPGTGSSADADWADHVTIGGVKLTKRQRWVYVYRNTGTGFETTPSRVKLEDFGQVGPVVLPQASVTEVVRAANPYLTSDQPVTLTDVTGDGRVDAMTSGKPGDAAGTLRRGFGVLRFTGAATLPSGGSNRDLAPAWSYVHLINPPVDNPAYQYRGIASDVNGDGLPDALNVTETGTEIRYNTGSGFGTASTGDALPFSTNHPDTKRLVSRMTHAANPGWNGIATEQYGYHQTRMADLDYDGLPDALRYDAGEGGTLYLNGGTSWVTSAAVDDSVAEALAGRADLRGVARDGAGQPNESGDRSDYLWSREAEALDVNADGLLDLVADFDGDGGIEVRYARHIVDQAADRAAPARLMRTISNGYGARTTVKYGRSTTASKWVVDELTTSPGQGEPDVRQKFSYGAAVHRPNPYGQHRFRGFATTVTLHPGDPDDQGDDLSAVTVHRYDQDPAGRPGVTATVLGDDAYELRGGLGSVTTVMSVVRHTHHVKELNLYAGGMTSEYPSNVVLPGTVTSYTCDGATGQTYADCLESPAASVTEEIIWQSRSSGGAYVMETVSAAERRFVNADGRRENRRTTSTHNLAWSASAFHLAPATVADATVLDGQTGVAHGSVAFAYHDAGYHRPRTVTVTDPRAETRVTRYTYHAGGAANGRVRKVWRPEQVHRHGDGDDAPGATEVGYDRFGLYPVRVTGAAGHVVTSVTDPATGAVLESSGPGYVCRDGADQGTTPDPASACPFDDALRREGTIAVVDGLGRVRSVSRRPQDGSAAVVVAEAVYDDRAAYDSGGVTPVSATMKTRVSPYNLSSRKVETDGLGRAVKETTSQFPNPSRVVTHDYDHGGRVTRVPRGDGQTGTVDVRTVQDALGRVTSVHEIGRSFMPFAEYTYSGTRMTVRQGTPGDGSLPAESTLTYDPAGQLVTVAERSGTDGQGAPVHATTSYRYDGLGRTVSMIDPDGVRTEMTHDYAGNRLTVTAAGRTWKYGYDRNDSLVSITEPVPAGGSEAAHTHHRAYDDIGRVTSETDAVRDLDQDERTRLWLGTTEHHYDRAHPSIATTGAAALYQVGMPSWSTGPGGTIVHTYDAFAHRATTAETLPALPGAPEETVTVTTTHDAAGNPLTTAYGATAGGATTFTGRTIETGNDVDGTPATLRFAPETGKTITVVQDRDDSGAVTRRTVGTAQAPGFSGATVDYGRDTYGRLKSLLVTAGSAQRYKQSVQYFDNGQVRSIQEQLGDASIPVATTFHTYDHRRQLTSATQFGGAGYRGTFTYTAGGRMASADVDTGGAARALTRDVEHVYQSAGAPGGDPRRLDALRRADGTELASYEYDEPGNMTSRTLPDGGTVRQRWDGFRLREVAAPDGEKETYYYRGYDRVAAVRHGVDGAVVETRRWSGDLEIVHTAGQAPRYRQYLRLGGETVGRLDHSGGAVSLEHYVTTPQGHHVLALSGTTGTATRLVSYGPFGEVLSESAAEDRYDREFNGKTFDPLGGQLYYGFRYYDPLALQWTSADPMFRPAPDLDPADPRAGNLYTFTGNNAVGMVDGTGLCTGDAYSDDCIPGGWSPGDFSPAAGPDHFTRTQDQVFAGLAGAAAEGLLFMTPYVGSLYQGLYRGDWSQFKIELAIGLAGGIIAKGARVAVLAKAASHVPGRTLQRVVHGTAAVVASPADDVVGAAAAKPVSRVVGKADDPLVNEIIEAIETRYPGHVRAQGIAIMKPEGGVFTDFDIVTGNAVIQVKTGSGRRALGQAVQTQALTDLPVIVHLPDASKYVVRELEKAGFLVTQTMEDLLAVIAP